MTWDWSTWSCLVLLRNDQKTFFQTQGVLATGDLACAPGHSVYMPLYRWDVTPVHQRKVESGAVFCEPAIEHSEGPSPSPWNSQPQQPWLEDQRHFRKVKWAGGLKKALGVRRYVFFAVFAFCGWKTKTDFKDGGPLPIPKHGLRFPMSALLSGQWKLY